MGSLLLRLLFAGLFLAAAAPKLARPAEFAVVVENYRLVPPLAAYVVGLWLPWLELVAALTLVFLPRLRAGAWRIVVALCAIFVVAQASAWLRGLDVSCGCFGGAGKVDGVSVATRALLLLLALAALRLEARRAAAEERAEIRP